MSEPYISVIIPMYNLENYIKDTVNSVLDSDYEKFELICVDDGSTDNTAALCEKIAEDNPKMKLILTENRGVSSARNTGLYNASGEYVIFMDGDDMLKNHALEIIAENTVRGCDILVFSAEISGDKKELPPDFITGSLSDTGEFEYSPCVLFERNGVFPFVWNKAFKRKFLLDNNLKFDVDLRLGEDQVFLLTVFPMAKKIRFISDKLYIYRFQRPDSASTILGKDSFVRCCCHLDDLEKAAILWKKNGYFEGSEVGFCQWCVHFAVNNVLMVKSHKAAVKLGKRLAEIIEKYDIPYQLAKPKALLKFNIVKSPFLLRIFFIYRIFRWHV